VESIVKALSEGAVDYFIKPLNIEKLKSELKKNLQSKIEQT
jgi:response regulator of citrate/malate metabolism